jgi:hypothetical protein
MLEWADLNIKHPWNCEFYYRGVNKCLLQLHFEDKQDAAIFIIFWGGE